MLKKILMSKFAIRHSIQLHARSVTVLHRFPSKKDTKLAADSFSSKKDTEHAADSKNQIEEDFKVSYSIKDLFRVK